MQEEVLLAFVSLRVLQEEWVAKGEAENCRRLRSVFRGNDASFIGSREKSILFTAVHVAVEKSVVEVKA